MMEEVDIWGCGYDRDPPTDDEVMAGGVITALVNGNPDDIDLLVKAGAKMSGKGFGYNLPLFEFCRMGALALHDVYGMKHAVRMTKHVLDCGAPVDDFDSHGMTALMWAAFYGHTPLVRLLLDYNASIDLQAQNERKETALMRACRTGGRYATATLVLAKADLHVKDANGLTAWSHAVMGGDSHVMRIIRNALDGHLPEPPPTPRSRMSKLFPRWRR